MQPDLVIFDCDGVLVDSELIAMHVMLDAIAAKTGLKIDAREAYDKFLGKSLATILKILEKSYHLVLPETALEDMRVDLFDHFRAELKPVPHIVEALDHLDMPICVASSSHLERIRLSLEITGLRSRFEPNIFSASMVRRGKPAPDLFLYAAHAMGADPKNCVVIEDSQAGIEAAHEACMQAFAFSGGAHADIAQLKARYEYLGPAFTFDDMRQLPHLLRGAPGE
ncbi:HAD family hydrolase [Methylovirgula sp. 4M-Z18]|uniref:HAD family hydrolase n=1 Tax=Methylovirgula sp. 4M-Z18 TaxID=2293567 RepID=UPI000E2E66B0|nr:HAD family hydrolase [Methylovirgula sp. 4M-Z18]RFB76305.1 HAD family hydrolase [Methylovirgula sp. 4M-Z18]